MRHDLISAVFALGGEDDLVRLLARVDALKRFLDSEDGANLLVAYRRASNIVRIEEKKDGKTYNSGVDGALLRQDEEKALYRALAASGEAGGQALESENFTGAMGALAQLRAPVDAFFDKVMVNAEDAALRNNRLALLRDLHALNRVADRRSRDNAVPIRDPPTSTNAGLIHADSSEVCVDCAATFNQGDLPGTATSRFLALNRGADVVETFRAHEDLHAALL